MTRPDLPVCALIGLTLLLCACAAPVAIPPVESASGAAVEAAGDSSVEFQRILACVEENFPAESYFTNDLLPDPEAAWEPMNCENVDKVKVGMSWILNDGGAPWYNAVELGFFSDVCLDVELVRGYARFWPFANSGRRRRGFRRQCRRRFDSRVHFGARRGRPGCSRDSDHAQSLHLAGAGS